jgi:hypothetical protein
MNNALALVMLLDIVQLDRLQHTAWWETPDVVKTRHEMYKAGLITRHARSPHYMITERGHAWLAAAVSTPLPVQQEVVTTKWVVPKAA